MRFDRAEGSRPCSDPVTLNRRACASVASDLTRTRFLATLSL